MTRAHAIFCALVMCSTTIHPLDIIWDLGGTLIERSTLSTVNAVGLWNSVKLYFKHGKELSDMIRTSLWDVLNLHDAQKGTSSSACDPQGSPLPQLMQDWFVGAKTSDELKEIARNLTDKYDGFYSGLHKQTVKNTFDWMFSPRTYAASWIPIRQAVRILSRCAKCKDVKGNPIRLFMLSNFDAHTFDFIQKNPANKVFFKYFDPDNIFISAHENVRDLKPNASIFKALTKKRNIDIKSSILIDDQKENCESFIKLGGQAIHVADGNFTDVPAKLKALGVPIPVH